MISTLLQHESLQDPDSHLSCVKNTLHTSTPKWYSPRGSITSLSSCEQWINIKNYPRFISSPSLSSDTPIAIRAKVLSFFLNHVCSRVTDTFWRRDGLDTSKGWPGVRITQEGMDTGLVAIVVKTGKLLNAHNHKGIIASQTSLKARLY